MHEDTHFDSAVSNIDSANSQEANKCKRKSLPSVVSCTPHVPVLHKEIHLQVWALLFWAPVTFPQVL